MVNYRDLVLSFKELGLDSHSHVIVHASSGLLGEISGESETVVGALLATCGSVIVPTFTCRTMIIPSTGPAKNAIEYGSGEHTNKEAEFFTSNLPSDDSMGEVAESIRKHPDAKRSNHPIYSFAAINAEDGLEAQTLEEPLAPIAWLAEVDGDVVLLGSDHRMNVSLHYAERLAGRKQFTRWALTAEGVVTCPNCPGCSEGLQSIAVRLEGVSERVEQGSGLIEVVPLRDLLHIAAGWIREDPQALLCNRPACDRCSVVRVSEPGAP